MHKPIVYSISDNDFKEIVASSISVDEVARKLGFAGKPGSASRSKIKSRMDNLHIKLGVSPSEDDTSQNDITSRKEFMDNYKDNKKRVHQKSNFDKTSDLGVVGEKYFEYLCAKNRIPCMRPISDTSFYDYVIYINSTFLKIQVKTTEFVDNKLGDITFRLTHGNDKTTKREVYPDDSFDYFFLFCNETSESFLYKYHPQSAVTFRERSNILYEYCTSKYKDEYTFDSVLANMQNCLQKN